MANANKQITVFYSWQSDLPNNTNRGFIQTALENAAKAIRKDDSIEVEPVIDRDVQGVPGSPNIAHTILNKIDNADVFVCDVSIINKGSRSRKTPNPNVLFELGYALKTLTEEKIILVMNTAYGKVEDLPFDLRMKSVLTYNIQKDVEDKASARKVLEKKLENGLREIINTLQESQYNDPPFLFI